MHLNLHTEFKSLLTDNTKIQIDNALKNHCKTIINISEKHTQTLAKKEQNIANKQLSQAQYKFFTDNNVMKLQEIFQTQFDKKSITIIH